MDSQDLNVWLDDATDTWKMALYEVDSNGSTDYSGWTEVVVTRDRLDRFRKISNDTDWWVGSSDPDFSYILFGTTKRR